ncbi:DUF4136 domain-containing protein [Teredinibacter sp. KSP-S5-2]|uniref:DUF4136 domain-containing protein n=1 Tax=Teredinibacter sp. KSP-S5-2 TaxID=3034506 RepID=UPI0029347C6F|nr:DUF4136 domain-containing protein [Teredinibacter sp. KSP-S5-2]WNO07682.1 DUF4136 domain-containing protein [Teredinibacter sp. KSP-S5-2]
MKKFGQLIFVLLSVLFIASCASQKTTTDYQPGYEFSSLKKYYLLPNPENTKDNPKVSQLDLKRIEYALENTLNTRFEKVEKEQADFWVRYHLLVEEKSDVRSVDVGFSRRNSWYYWGIRDEDVYTVHYQEGSIIVDFLDAKTEDVVWRGVTKGKIKPKLNPSERQSKVVEEINNLLQLFPPTP